MNNYYEIKVLLVKELIDSVSFYIEQNEIGYMYMIIVAQ